MSELQTKVGELEFKTPLFAASGTWAYGQEFLHHSVQDYLGTFITKSLSVKPSQGNPMPRLYETDGGLLNSIGLQNLGIDAFLEKYEPELKKANRSYVLSIYAHKTEDFKTLAEKANDCSAVAVELNISCPNVDKGGLEFSCDPTMTKQVVSAVRKRLKKPLWVKLSPNVTSISDIAVAAESAGADAISMINTLLGMAIDVESKRPWLGRMVGGLSGPAIRPVAVRSVFQTYQKVKIPIVGIGGIRSARDVLEFLMAGASAVQIGTWNYRNPNVYESVARDLQTYMARHKIDSLSEIVGIAHKK